MSKKIKISWKKCFVKRLFCKHDFKYYAEQTNDINHILLSNGERRHYVCSKCGKYKGSIFLEYEGMGFKYKNDNIIEIQYSNYEKGNWIIINQKSIEYVEK